MVGRMTGSMVGGMSGPLTLRKGGFDWYPSRLFHPGDILLWYDPSDLSTMYQDVAGTSPVTADGQSVLLMLDKGQWGGKTLAQVLAAQAELSPNIGPYTDTSNWTAANSATLASVSGELEITAGATFSNAYILVPVTEGKYYDFIVTSRRGTATAAYVSIINHNTTGLIVDGFSNANLAIGSTSTAIRGKLLVPTGCTNVRVLVVHKSQPNGRTLYVSSVTVKEIPGYHRVQATPSQAPKYKTDGTLHWLLYDGTDDGSVTPTINWGTDEVAICAGVTKSSDAAAGAFAELSATSASNNGTFAMLAPASAAANYYWRSKGTGDANMTVTTYTAPTTNVLTGQGKIATDLATLRADGSEVGTSATDQGTGNFGNHILYFGRRGGSSLPFNGREHQTVIRSRLLSSSELAKLETFTAAKTGVIL
jgi:hypothetical protein